MLLTELSSNSNALSSAVSGALSPSDQIQLFGIILSTIISLIAVIISVVTLRQNNKMVEESTRPYVIVYMGIANFQSPSYYMVLKNFGQTGAHITKFSCDYDLSKCSFSPNIIPFEHIENTFIAPGQSFCCSVDPIKLFKDPKPITINISYMSGKQTYNDCFVLNIEADSDLLHNRASTQGKELKIISYTLQDIAEKML